ncbi:FO synthase subunit 1, partial [Durusdinium trenchii]
DWSKASSLVKAFSIGKQEALAVVNLQSKVHASVLKQLKIEVSKRGLRSFLTHEAIARGVFNTGFSSAVSTNEAWDHVLTNSDDQELVKLFLVRICSDWDKRPASLRKGLSFKECAEIHTCCGMYLHYIKSMEETAPADAIHGTKEKFLEQFLTSGLDAELLMSAQSTVPPGDPKSIGAFRLIIAKYETQLSMQAEDKLREAAEKVFKATFDQIKAQIDSDLKILREKLPSREAQTIELAQDMKYMKDRQMYVIASLDATVWPVSAPIMDCLTMLTNVCALNPGNVGHIQLPQVQAQTTLSAVTKHRHQVELALLKADMDFSTSLTLAFQKESARSGADKRPASQVCLIAYSGKTCKWNSSDMLQNGFLGGVPLIKVSDMEGYDAETRPGAAARVEQILASSSSSQKGIPCHKTIIEGYLDGHNFNEKDIIVFAEFGKACAQRMFDGLSPPVRYYGLFRDAQRGVVDSIEASAFSHWDSLGSSPPKSRPRQSQEAQISGLQLLTHSKSGPGWPPHIMEKFPAESVEFKELHAMKVAFENEYPPAAHASPASGTTRVRGEPDFSADGVAPIDWKRVVQLAPEATPGVDERLGFAAGRGGRPSVIVDKRMAIWLGNESDESVTWSGIEICGFGTGQFEPKIVRGGVRDVSGLAFRLRNDATLVSHNKTLMSVAHFMQHFAATSGLATIEIEDHVTEPMLQRPASCLQLSWC